MPTRQPTIRNPTSQPSLQLSHPIEALKAAREMEKREEQARGHVRTAAVLRAGNDAVAESNHLHEALKLCTASGSPRAQQVAKTLGKPFDRSRKV
jgi:hypothetical protein